MKKSILRGIKDGIPIGLGYFAVSFSLGIAAKNAGLNAFQGFIASLLTNASAGEYAIFRLIAVNATYLQVAIMTLVANARYLLMSTALAQRFNPETKFIHRLFVAFDVTDEIFGISIAQPGYIDPYYSYGAFIVCLPAWATGTALGIIMGNLLPANVVSALSVALYGMFLAIIIPPSKKDKIVGALVVISFTLSYFVRYIPVIKDLSAGTQTILLTVSISAVAAILFPKKGEEHA